MGGFFSGSIDKGEVFDFLAFEALGISSFTILGIDPNAGVDPNDPFIVGVKFMAGNFDSTISIDAITVDTDPPVGGVIPLPGGMVFVLGGLGMLGLLRRGRQAARA